MPRLLRSSIYERGALFQADLIAADDYGVGAVVRAMSTLCGADEEPQSVAALDARVRAVSRRETLLGRPRPSARACREDRRTSRPASR